MDIVVEKEEIIRRLNSLDDPDVIERIKRIKKREAEPFDFEKERANGLTLDEARKSTKEFLASLPWKGRIASMA